jgi:hypothetical protein
MDTNNQMGGLTMEQKPSVSQMMADVQQNIEHFKSYDYQEPDEKMEKISAEFTNIESLRTMSERNKNAQQVQQEIQNNVAVINALEKAKMEHPDITDQELKHIKERAYASQTSQDTNTISQELTDLSNINQKQNLHPAQQYVDEEKYKPVAPVVRPHYGV